MCLIWWYQELERRLLVVRHHLSEDIPLICSPLSPGLCIELFLNVFHLPPGLQFPSECQLIIFIRIYHIVKVILNLDKIEVIFSKSKSYLHYLLGLRSKDRSVFYKLTLFFLILSLVIKFYSCKFILVHAGTSPNEISQDDWNSENYFVCENFVDIFVKGKSITNSRLLGSFYTMRSIKNLFETYMYLIRLTISNSRKLPWVEKLIDRKIATQQTYQLILQTCCVTSQSSSILNHNFWKKRC